MKITVITACLNNKDILEDCINSVLTQKYRDVEYIIVDGGSKNGTAEILRKYKDKVTKVISEKDDGLYYALNKGLKVATGDVIGFLNADDIYASNYALSKVASIFEKYNLDSCYAELEYVAYDNIKNVIRYWKSSSYEYDRLKYGWMPPHPTFFVKKWVYEKYGFFNTSFNIASDYEIILRFLYKHRISSYFIDEILIKMRLGGMSNRNIKNIIAKSKEDYVICKMYGLGYSTLFFKNVMKMPQFILRG